MSDDKRTEITTAPEPQKAGVFKLPSKSQLRKGRSDAAKAQQATAEVAAGTVIGLDTDQYTPAIIDLTLAPARIEYYRRRYAQKGYAKVEGSPIVVGYTAAEVWVKLAEDHDADRAARRRQIEAAVISGRMAKSALGSRAHVEPALPSHTVI